MQAGARCRHAGDRGALRLLRAADKPESWPADGWIESPLDLLAVARMPQPLAAARSRVPSHTAERIPYGTVLITAST